VTSIQQEAALGGLIHRGLIHRGLIHRGLIHRGLIRHLLENGKHSRDFDGSKLRYWGARRYGSCQARGSRCDRGVGHLLHGHAGIPLADR